MTTDYPIIQIAKMIGVSQETVLRIECGETFYDDSLSYPLRNL